MSVWLFLLFLSGCLIGDFLSFAQTRVFLRSVDGSRQGVISVGLALSDAIISLAIFVGAFTITRLIAYLVIICASTQGPIQQVQRLNTAAISYAIRSSIADGLATPLEVEWSSYIASISSAKDASRFDEINRRYTNDLVRQNRDRDIVSVNVKIECVNDPYIPLADLGDSSRLIAKEISGRRGLELNGTPFENLRKDILKRLEGWRPTNKSCPALTLVLEQSLTPAGLLSVSGIWNGVAASFERTLFYFYQNFGFKLAPYASVDPEKDIGLFYDSLISQTQFGILGLMPGDINLQYALSEFYYKSPKQTEPLQIPFSLMLASSLTISLFF